MQHKTLLASALALLIAGSASLAFAQDKTPQAPPAPMAGPHGMPGAPGMGRHGDWMHHGPGMRRMGDQGSGVIADLRGLEHLYRQAGRTRDLAAVYNEVLARSQDPRVRAYAYHQLARAQAQPINLDAAIATMRKSLDESLANEAKHRAEIEQMRARWEQKQGATAKDGGGR
ncbi:hypothetical protein [Dyella lutea]|uniref:Spy/CpxP family protein refolding chaperone n=1 Tax=Dyella lutea TaxID=2950441 RepID=A0ABT1F9K6_9GAMM|nr:hypothetical protein [Dyella lutea]MCP1374044.1 hypothetical protein [Dyella lutea]